MYTGPNLGLGNMAQLLVEVPPAEPKWYFCIFRQNKLELLKKIVPFEPFDPKEWLHVAFNFSLQSHDHHKNKLGKLSPTKEPLDY